MDSYWFMVYALLSSKKNCISLRQAGGLHSFQKETIDQLIHVTFFFHTVVAVLCGILVGPYGIGLIHIEDEQFQQDFTRQFSRIVIAIQVFSVLHLTCTAADSAFFSGLDKNNRSWRWGFLCRSVTCERNGNRFAFC